MTDVNVSRQNKSRRIRMAGYLILALVALVVFQPSMHAPFVLDDIPKIRDNGQIRQIWDLATIFDNTRRPVLYFTLAVNYALHGLDVRGYHLGNLFIHILAALVLFGIVRQTFCAPLLKGLWTESRIQWFSFSVAGLWLLHPLQTQSVSYVIQRAESLMGLFYLLAIYGFVRYVKNLSAPWMAVSIIMCALGMGTKEVMFTAPLTILLYDRTFWAGSFREIWEKRRRIYAGLFSTWVFLFGLLIFMKPESQPSAGFNMTSSNNPLYYALTQSQVILHYLMLTFKGGPLVFDYEGWPLVKHIDQIYPQLFGIILIFAVSSWAWASKRIAGFFMIIFFLILAPTSSIMPIKDVAFEYRMYLPLASLVILGVVFLNFCADRLPFPRTYRHILLGLSLTLIALYWGHLTYQRNRVYGSELSLWQDTVRKRPDNPRARNNLAAAYINQGNFSTALEQIQESLALFPDDEAAYNNLGLVYMGQKKLDLAAQNFRKSLQLNPHYDIAQNNLGILFMNRGLFEEAEDSFIAAIALKPDQIISRIDRAALYRQRKQWPEARDVYEQVLALDPTHREGLFQLVEIYLHLGDSKSALFKARQILKYEKDPKVLTQMGSLLARYHFARAALSFYKKSFNVNPLEIANYLEMGKLYGNLNNFDAAISIWEQGLKIAPQHQEFHVLIEKAQALKKTGRRLQ